VGDAELLGGLDLGATLASGRTVAQKGLLARADGGALLLAMAERLQPMPAALIAGALDRGEIVAERDGMTLRAEARFALIALDEGLEADERLPAPLAERLAFRLDLGGLSHRDCEASEKTEAEAVAAARARLASVVCHERIIAALCAACLALGVDSGRAPLFALKAARAHAAREGRAEVNDADAALAARLVLAPRATRLPPDEIVEEEADQEPPPPDTAPEPPPDQSADPSETKKLEDVVLEAALAALPPGLLAQLRVMAARQRAGQTGKAGDAQATVTRGRPIGARRGDPRAGVRLDLLHTLRAAAPWQRLRKRLVADPSQRPPLEIRRDDMRVKRFKDRKQTTTIFVVDASGSTAMQRLGEAKGAVELMLAECYVRRDEVALISFRGEGAELLLPPTRSLHRAKKELAAMPGGGGTPLAAGIVAAGQLADEVKRKGRTPTVVMITDGRANVTREGTGGRQQAQDEAQSAAKLWRSFGYRTLLVDNSNRPEPRAGQLADAMGALYLALPRANAELITQAVRAVAPQGARA
jgi:magnesium chelatase subunit D